MTLGTVTGEGSYSIEEKGATLIQWKILNECFMLLIFSLQKVFTMNKEVCMLVELDLMDIFSSEQHFFQGE